MAKVKSCAIEQRLHDELKSRQELGQLRSLELVEGVDFCSNDYLGLAHRSISSADELDLLPHGSTGSRLVSGNTPEILSFESSLAHFHGFEQCLLFSSGYAANSGLLACLGKKGDLMLLDSLAHASLIDGARLSFAKRARFSHNDVDDVANQISKFNANKSVLSQQAFVVVEAVYSMDGDIAPLLQLVTVCKRLNACLVVDEAHSVGLYGKQGAGLIAELELQEDVFAAVYTFGKAVGIHGAVIAGSKTLREYLVNYCRPFIYTTAPSPRNVIQLSQAYQKMKGADEAREILASNLAYFEQKVKSLPLKKAKWIGSDSPIQGLVIGETKQAKQLELLLRDSGFALKAIVSPTVAEGSERIRICIHSTNTAIEIDQFAQSLAKHVGIE